MVDITREHFIDATGRDPVNDDLDRCNCPYAGQMGHFLCGWDSGLELPVFMAVTIWANRDLLRDE
jgi:hypothetical protein